MDKRTTVGYLFVLGFLKAYVSSQYCDAAHGETPFIQMCKTTSISTIASDWLYLDTTGAPRFREVSCSCELHFDFTTALNTKYRAQEETTCGLRFQLNDEDWDCEDEDVHVIQVNSLSNITFYKTLQSQRTAYGCMGLKPGAGTLTVNCFPWQAYTPPATTVSGATTTPTTTSTVSTTSTTSTTTTTTGTTSTATTAETTVTSPTTSKTLSTTDATKTPTASTTGTTSVSSSSEESSSTVPTATPSGGTSQQTDSQTSSTEAAGGASSTEGAAGASSTGAAGRTTTPRTAEAVEDKTNTAAIAGGVVGGVLGLVLLIVLVVCLICLIGRRKKEKKEKVIVFGPRSVRYNSDASANDVQITENALYDGENPSAAMNQLFIGGIPPTPGAQDGELPRFDAPDGNMRYAEIGAKNDERAKLREEPELSSFRKASSSSDTAELKLNNEYSEIDTGITNPSYDSGYKAPYTMPIDNKLGVGTGEKAESTVSSPYDYIDNDKLERDNQKASSSTGDYVRLITNPNDQTDNVSGPGSRLGSESGPGVRSGSESGPDPGSGYANSPSPGYANSPSPGYASDRGQDDAHFGYDQV